MTDAVTLLAPDGQPAAGRDFDASRGLTLRIAVPPGRRLAGARLEVAAADASELAPSYPPVVADSGAMAGKPDAPWQWASADWGEPRALVGLTLDASPPTAGALTPPRRAGARVRIFARDTWLPLAPLDTLPAGGEQRFPAQCAARLSAEMLIEGDAADKRTGVLVPGTLTGRRIGVRFTRQPCLLQVAIGDDPPFLAPAGPVPAEGITVDGLARLANRYLTDHPGADAIPLRVATANAQLLRIVRFDGELAAIPPPSRPPPPEPPDRPRPGERALWPERAAATRLARLCDAGHATALRLAPLPDGVRLSSLSLLLRGASGACATLSVHADAAGAPATPTLVSWPLPLADGNTPTWHCVRLPQPLALADQPWWLICSAGVGDVLWYVADTRPAPLLGAFFRRGSGPWLPLDTPSPAPWLQLRAGVLDPEA